MLYKHENEKMYVYYCPHVEHTHSHTQTHTYSCILQNSHTPKVELACGCPFSKLVRASFDPVRPSKRMENSVILVEGGPCVRTLGRIRSQHVSLILRIGTVARGYWCGKGCPDSGGFQMRFRPP